MTQNKIEKNMLRDRAKPLPIVTDEMWNNVLEEHRELVDEFLEGADIRPKSRKQYTSALKQFFYWVHKSLNDKPLYKISKRDFIRYNNYLKNRGMSSSGLNLKKSAVSSLNNYIENIISEDDKRYEKFRNFTRGLPPSPKTQTYEKVKITYEEYQDMMNVLEGDDNYLGMAWLATAFNVGGRKAEIIQFKTEILDYEIPEEQNYVLSHTVFGKGRGEGKPLKYMINKDALHYMKLWVEKRGYDHEYIFTTTYGGKHKQMSESWADYFCEEVLEDILLRRVNPHIFKASAVTYLVEVKKVPIEIVSKYVAHHEDISTTLKFYDLRDFEEERNKIFM